MYQSFPFVTYFHLGAKPFLLEAGELAKMSPGNGADITWCACPIFVFGGNDAIWPV
jgi:hypothetical protein